MARLEEGKAINGCRFRYGKKRASGFREKVWSIKHSVDGKQINEGLGAITQKRALEISADLKNNKAFNKKNAGKGIQRLPETYAEMQAVLDAEKQADKAAEAKEKQANITFNFFFERFVDDRKNAGRPHAEIVQYRSRYAKWIEPVFGKKAPREIALFDLQRLVKSMKRKAAPSTIVKVIGIVSLAFSHNAKHHGYSGGNPVVRKDVFEFHKDIIKSDNQRERYLSPTEAKELLESLPSQVSAMAKLSLMCGFRAGELFSMKWADINFTTGRINIRDTKSGAARSIVMGKKIIALLQPIKGKKGELVFPNPKGGQYREIPKSFKKTVDALGLNSGITDRRQKIVFHSLRHTCGSWLVDNGVDLFTVQKVLGHKSIKTTERYVHSTGQLDRAATVMDGVMSKARNEEAAEKIINN